MIVPGHPRISADPAIRFGRATIAGTRMGVTDILGALAAGDTIEELIADYAYVDEEAIRACLAYAADLTNRSAVVTAD